ncbi:MAG: hypothetical protein K0R54_5809 [Clostridiaceae bacterium]|jgi:hypothetical protein|nr:hypothetical protein [Clostridiaceae bacterium]MDF2951045.1 hypothetical protein [Anaerocolumna sp.]
MNKLISIADVYTLINNPNITLPSQMKNNNIYSYLKIPNSTLQVKNYICFDFSSRKSPVNSTFKNVNINVSIICHETDLKTSWGNRHDVLSGVIIDAFNWSNFLGFELELVSDNEKILENDYHMRTLQFNNLTTDNFINKVN